jgi:hypothetical protein
MKTDFFKTEFLCRLACVKEQVSLTNKASVLIIQQIPTEKEGEKFLLPHVRESISNIICFVELGDTSLIDFIFDNAIGVIDKIILDSDIKRTNSIQIINSILKRKEKISISTYSDLDMWGSASVDFMLALESNFFNKKILLLGNNYLTTRLLLNLLNKEAIVSMFENDYDNGHFKFNNHSDLLITNEFIRLVDKSDVYFDVLIGGGIMELYPGEEKLQKMDFANIYDIGLHNFSKDFINSNIKKNINIYRFDNRAGISSVVLNIMETDYLIKNNLGKVFVNDIPVVSGGQMGEEGAIVVDNSFNPKLVLGIADGTGMFKSKLDENDIKNIEIINFLIHT